MEFGDEIKQLHARITKNNEELITLMSKQHLEQQQELNNLRNCMNDRVAKFLISLDGYLLVDQLLLDLFYIK